MTSEDYLTYTSRSRFKLKQGGCALTDSGCPKGLSFGEIMAKIQAGGDELRNKILSALDGEGYYIYALPCGCGIMLFRKPNLDGDPETLSVGFDLQPIDNCSLHATGAGSRVGSGKIFKWLGFFTENFAMLVFGLIFTAGFLGIGIWVGHSVWTSHDALGFSLLARFFLSLFFAILALVLVAGFSQGFALLGPLVACCAASEIYRAIKNRTIP